MLQAQAANRNAVLHSPGDPLPTVGHIAVLEEAVKALIFGAGRMKQLKADKVLSILKAPV